MGRFIVGIYNYCDYWCKRCAFTSRCRNYQADENLIRGGHDETDDATNQAFWGRLARKLHEDMAFGKDTEDEWSHDPRDTGVFALDADDYSEVEAAMDVRNKAVKTHPLSRLAETYRIHAHDWLQEVNSDLKALAAEWLAAAGKEYDETDYEEAALEVGDLIEVVAWYHTMIYPKISRALGGLAEPFVCEGETARIIRETRDYDAAGSGKVALISVERSIASLMRLRDILPKQEDKIIDLLIILDRLRCGVRQAIPGAETFKRPGFDTEAGIFEDCDER